TGLISWFGFGLIRLRGESLRISFIFINSGFQIEKHSFAAQGLAKLRSLNAAQHFWIESNKPDLHSLLSPPFFSFSELFKCSIFHIDDGTEIDYNHSWICLIDQLPGLVSKVGCICEENGAFRTQQEHAGERFILWMLFRTRPEHIGSWLSPQHMNRGISNLCGEGNQRNDNRNDNSLKCPQQ